MGSRFAIVGVGNILMGDEGAGVEAVRLIGEMGLPEGVDLIDAGTAFFTIAPGLDKHNYKKLFIIDAVKGGGKPGTLYRFTMDEVDCGIGPGKEMLSLHDFGVLEALKLERLIGRLPEEIIFYGIEPEVIKLSMEISPVVRKSLKVLSRRLLDELEVDNRKFQDMGYRAPHKMKED
ncbi:MAG: hydrogenase maturation protease [Spirochaetota bacterium]